MEESTLAERRDRENMVSPLGRNPICRTVHFLKPSLKHIENPSPHDVLLPKTLFSSQTTTFDPKNLPLEVKFSGWMNPLKGWEDWEEKLRPKYEHIWRKVGIDEAIKSSRYEIQRNKDLILGLAHKWYFETNTFIFSWGEATITLEDVMVCGGYSVMGNPIFSPLEDDKSKEMAHKLDQERRNLATTKARKANHLPWLKHFFTKEEDEELTVVEDDDEELEHAAFLSLWLSRSVFPCPIISKDVLPIATHLARGTQIALAPAILASIYRDLTLLKKGIDKAISNLGGGTRNNVHDYVMGSSILQIILRAPLKLVEIWAFERFSTLHPHPPPPNLIEHNQSRIAKWHKAKMLDRNHQHVNYYVTFLDSCGETFKWRPYVNSSPKFYNQEDGWVWFSTTCHGHNKDYLESFARCLRHSELVGMGLGVHYTEKYLPHRVGMQFGLDQDIPATIDFDKINKDNTICGHFYEIAWKNYDKPITYTMLLDAAIASSSILEPSMTCKYLEWWKQSKLGCKEKPNKDNFEQITQGDSVPKSIGVSSNADFGVKIINLTKRSEIENVLCGGGLMKRARVDMKIHELETKVGELEGEVVILKE